MANRVRAAGVGAGAQHHAVTDARNNAAPHSGKHQVRIRQRCYKRGEQIGKEAQKHKARRGLHHVEHAALAHNDQQQQGIHHDGLDTDGKRHASRRADRLDNSRKARNATGGKTVGNQKQVGRDGGQGTPQHDLGQVVKEVHRKNALDVQTICHAASLKKAHPNGCALNFFLYSILPIRRTKTTPAQGLFWIQTRPTVGLGIGLKPRCFRPPSLLHRRCRSPSDDSQ